MLNQNYQIPTAAMLILHVVCIRLTICRQQGLRQIFAYRFVPDRQDGSSFDRRAGGKDTGVA